MKFGGTSVANLSRIKNVVQIVENKILRDSKRIILPIERVVATMIGETTFGRICVSKIRSVRAPIATAARTNSRRLIDSVSARTSRATVVHPTSETMNIIR